MIQRSVNPMPHDEPWCMDYVHWCVDAVNQMEPAIFPCKPKTPVLMESESVMRVYENYVKRGFHVFDKPVKGTIAIWDRGKGRGHCGIVFSASRGHFFTVEGNTSPPDGKGPEGVWTKHRSLYEPPSKDWKLKGFIDAWGDSSAGKTESYFIV